MNAPATYEQRYYFTASIQRINRTIVPSSSMVLHGRLAHASIQTCATSLTRHALFIGIQPCAFRYAIFSSSKCLPVYEGCIHVGVLPQLINHVFAHFLVVHWITKHLIRQAPELYFNEQEKNVPLRLYCNFLLQTISFR